MSGMYKTEEMTEHQRWQKLEEQYRDAKRNLNDDQVVLVEKYSPTEKEQDEINSSGILSYARRVFVDLYPLRRKWEYEDKGLSPLV